ncbi:hypothetical protein [Yoonia sp.]|uniref:hypothetical protein n=1 Tax=Yoonia sp. TaxID=2212373 RepID=UPI00358ED6E1
MADSYIERVAGELADLALADEKVTHDERIVPEIGEILGSSSQTLQEAFLTAIRVRRAETRARKLLAERAAKPGRQQSRLINDTDTAETGADTPIAMGSSTSAPKEEKPAQPESKEDAAFADVLNTLDEFLQADEPETDANPAVSPNRPSRG